MKTFSFSWSDQLRVELGKAAPQRGYTMSLVGEDRQAVICVRCGQHATDDAIENLACPGR